MSCSAYNEFGDSTRGYRSGIVKRFPALVAMIVPIEDKINPLLCQQRPHRRHILRIINGAHEINRVMVERDRADVRMSSKISSQPLILGGSGMAAAYSHAVTVD